MMNIFMLERFSRWWRENLKKKEPLFQDVINPLADPELRRLACLIDEANFRIRQGGDALLEQKMMDVIGKALQYTRQEIVHQSLEELATQLETNTNDLFYAEAGILEPDLFFSFLPTWAQTLGHEPDKLAKRAETLCLGLESGG
jgi:hypothetical protein